MTSYNVQHFSYIWDYIIGFPVAQEYKRIHALFLLQGFMTNKFNIPGRLNFFGAKVRKSARNACGSADLAITLIELATCARESVFTTDHNRNRCNLTSAGTRFEINRRSRSISI